MPELPEVETIKSGLSKLIVNKTVRQVTADNPKSFPNSEDLVQHYLINAEVISVQRRAKVLIINLSGDYSLVTHLKMTGQLVYRSRTANFGAGHPTDSLIGELPDKSTRVIVSFSDGSKLFFNDQRKFGWMCLVATSDVMKMDFLSKVGPEPLESGFTWQVLRDRLAKHPNLPIKAALLNQTVLAGIGNIYADESLWGAKIYPGRLVKTLSARKIHRLRDEIVFVLGLAIQKGGSTDKNYVDAEGKKGSYLSFARVFRREHQPCPRCGAAIKKIRLAGRGTHFCPVCQPPR